MDSGYNHFQLPLYPSKTAIVVIDPWASHPNDGWTMRAGRNMEDKLAPFLAASRDAGIRVFYAPTNREISKTVEPDPRDVVINSPRSADDHKILDNLLSTLGIDTIIYAGYATNICALNKPAGAETMWRVNPSRRFILARDATIGFEMPDTIEGEWLKRAAIWTFEYRYGVSMTVSDFMEAASQSPFAASER